MVAVSVVIPTLKPREDVKSVEYLRRGDFDDYEELIQDEHPVTRARNAGIERASADKIVFLDDDSRPRPEYLSRANETLDREAAVAGRTIHPRDDIFSRHFTDHYEFWIGDESAYVDHFWGCNMAVRAEVFEDVGYWDEQMGWGHEEKELARRVRENYHIYYNPEMVVEHSYAKSIPDYWRKQYKLETMTPYYWDKTGVPRRKQIQQTVTEALRPGNYVGRTVPCVITRAGATVARTAGRVKGLLTR
ncbi:glycosyltransferase family 2 protein [Halorubrum sp. Ea8]|uniref:glycosyltransferase family 2 protein n=1 Tax=Halorubrum sp. Ea8 TaxID=1383841 RepID=UPI000B998836|nr:glycosyltransferase family 2 protein [Halorubrum sp. Ea8]OYR49862.1 family 2 glycosyl transferase [Halorubrum sp. Ea8]